MTYPEGAMAYLWDGRGTTGPSADCVIASTEVRLAPKKAFSSFLGWPEVVLPRAEIREAEEVFFGRYRFRLTDILLDGACFRPIGSKRGFLDALNMLRIPIAQPSTTEKLAFELKTTWNQMRWGGRRGRRHWRRQRSL